MLARLLQALRVRLLFVRRKKSLVWVEGIRRCCFLLGGFHETYVGIYEGRRNLFQMLVSRFIFGNACIFRIQCEANHVFYVLFALLVDVVYD
jgi:hypothetical protein